jgi:hypothetical protein
LVKLILQHYTIAVQITVFSRSIEQQQQYQYQLCLGFDIERTAITTMSTETETTAYGNSIDFDTENGARTATPPPE